jgi:hypothetical protein
MTDREEFIAALESPKFSHVSVRRWCGLQAYVYHHDGDSPSGVTLAGGLPLDEADPILAARHVPAHLGPQRGDLAGAGTTTRERDHA